MLLKLTGVSEVIEDRGSNNDKIVNFEWQKQHEFFNSVLVKGIKGSITLKAKFVKPAATINCTYWCKNCQAEVKVALLEFDKEDIITKVLCSKSDDESQQDKFYD